MSENMYDLTGWHKVGCRDSDDLRTQSLSVASSLTDPDGHYGPPVVFTERALAGGTPTLRDYRYPHSDRPCEHYESDLLVPLPQDGEPCA